MKLWRFYASQGLTGSWHSGGGGYVVSATREAALQKIMEMREPADDKDDLADLEIEEVPFEEGQYYLVADSGCC